MKNTQHPKVSIIIPIYNVEKYISLCIESVLNQSFRDYEVLLINDGTPDNSILIAHELVKHDDRFIFLNKKNGGLPSARNLGLDHASGDYIVFLDSDDYIDKTFIEKMYHTIRQENADVCVCDMHYIKDNTIIRTTNVNVKQYYTKNDYLLTLNSIPAFACAKIYKKSLFQNLRYDENVKTYEDSHFTFRVIYGKKITQVKEALLYYVQREGSITQTISPNFLNDKRAVSHSYITFSKKHGLFKKYYKYILYSCYCSSFIGVMIIYARFSVNYKTDITNFYKSLEPGALDYTKIFSTIKYNKNIFISLLLIKLTPSIFKFLINFRDRINNKR